MPFSNRYQRRSIGLIRRLIAPFLLLTLLPLSTLAQESNQPAPTAPVIRPSNGTDAFLSIELNPGESATLLVDVINPSAAPLAIRTYAVDALTLVNGGFGVEDAGAEPSGPTRWIDYPDQELTIDPGIAARLPVHLTVPADAEPGEYLSAIAAEPAEASPIDGTSGFRQLLRQAIALFVTIPGEMTSSLELADPAWVAGNGSSAGVVRIPVTNAGDRFLVPSGSFVLADNDGAVIDQRPVKFGPIYAGTSTRFELMIAAPLAPGVYTITLDLHDERTGWSTAPEHRTMRITVT